MFDLSSAGGEDVGVTGINDGHGGATEELTAGGTELDLLEGTKKSAKKVLSKAGIEASSQSCEALLARRPVAGLYCACVWSVDRGMGDSYVVAVEVVDVGLGEHGVVLELRLAERRGVASNDDELGLAAAESLEGRLVSEGDW
jgi:hypothetical protein